MFGATTGSLSEIAGLDGFAPDYRRVLLDWLRERFALARAAAALPHEGS